MAVIMYIFILLFVGIVGLKIWNFSTLSWFKHWSWSEAAAEPRNVGGRRPGISKSVRERDRPGRRARSWDARVGGGPAYRAVVEAVPCSGVGAASGRRRGKRSRSSRGSRDRDRDLRRARSRKAWVGGGPAYREVVEALALLRSGAYHFFIFLWFMLHFSLGWK